MKIPVRPPSIRYFETVKRVLDRSLATVCSKRGLSEDAASDLLVKQLQTMSREWFSGKTPNIAYEDPMCRLAYLYCHVPANANLRNPKSFPLYSERAMLRTSCLSVSTFFATTFPR